MFGKIEKSYTEFYGVKGEFSPPNSNVLVHHVNTVAKNGGGSGNEIFLEHLKPLREYVDITKIQTLDDVLQRDLDDSRVAKGIVRYLLEGNIELPTFFPSIGGAALFLQISTPLVRQINLLIPQKNN